MFYSNITLENLALVVREKKASTSVVLIEKLEGIHEAGNGNWEEIKDVQDYKSAMLLQNPIDGLLVLIYGN